VSFKVEFDRKCVLLYGNILNLFFENSLFWNSQRRFVRTYKTNNSILIVKVNCNVKMLMESIICQFIKILVMASSSTSLSKYKNVWLGSICSRAYVTISWQTLTILIVCLCNASMFCQGLQIQGNVVTLAGGGGQNAVLSGSANGLGTFSTCNSPEYIITNDATSQLYISDTGNHLIRQMSLTTGLVNTLAGSVGVVGTSNGFGTYAYFNFPRGLALDSLYNNLVIADSSNHVLRIVSISSGVATVTTFAGSVGFPGYADSVGTFAKFKSLAGIFLSRGSGSYYVADRGNHLIRVVTALGVVLTIAGTAGVPGYTDGFGTFASFIFPTDVVLDGTGNAYVSDQLNYVIRKINSNYLVTTLAGSGNPEIYDGVGLASGFLYPAGIKLDIYGNLIVGDGSANAIRMISSVAVVVTTIGGSKSGVGGRVDSFGTFSLFRGPVGVWIDMYDNVYIADTSNNLIRKITGPPLPTR